MSERKITFKIVTPERLVYQNEVDEITAPTKTGVVTVLPNHVGMVSLIDGGEIIVKNEKESTILHIHKGVIEVKPGSRVTVLADSADHVSELNEEKIKQAKERVERILADKENLSEIEYARYQDLLVRELSKLKILEKYR